jgi:hypothetical protein
MNTQKFNFLIIIVLLLPLNFAQAQEERPVTKFPWDNGKLKVSNNRRFLQHENGKPFF